jgi:cytidylate kinase
MTNKIGICGHCCTGKTSVGKEVADRLGYEFISIGEYYRKKGVIERISDDWKLNNHVHRFTEELLLDPKDAVIDGRSVHMSGLDIKLNKGYISLMILLEAGFDTRLKRYLLRHPDNTIEEAKNKLRIRTVYTNQTLQEYYKFDVFDKNLFDRIYTTDDLEITDIASAIIIAVKEVEDGVTQITDRH